ncbi:uncharacterized protein TNCV_1696981, partial [Trichonephila clavipes]
KAIDQLKERFGREDLLVQIYVRDLLTLVMKNAATGRAKADLPLLYDELESKLRSLESLGKTQDKIWRFLTPQWRAACLRKCWSPGKEARETIKQNPEGSRSLEQLDELLLGKSKSKIVFLQMLCVIRCQGQEKLIRAVIDSGSQSTYDWEKIEHLNSVPDLEVNKECHYLAHRPVIKLDSQTTKIRPVLTPRPRKGNLL